MRTDPAYQANQKQAQAEWLQGNEEYWKGYREAHPEQAERNRVLQKVRNRRRSTGIVRMDASMIAKMDASRSRETSSKLSFYGQFWLVPEIAKMDAIKVNLCQITRC